MPRRHATIAPAKALVMTESIRYFVPLWVLLLALQGCSSGIAGVTKGVLDKVFEPGPTTLDMQLIAEPGMNPDSAGRPSPLVVRVYELKNLSIFTRTDFFTLYDQDTAMLSDALVNNEEMRLRPGDSRRLTRELQPDTRYVAVLGAYRDIENAIWRKSVAVVPHQENRVSVTLQPLGIRLDQTGG